MRIGFYLSYAARNLLRSARWTTFAVFCIAAGVATIVALRTLGLGILDSLVDNARTTNHGDLTISQAANSGFSFSGPSEGRTYSRDQVARVQAWAEEQNARIALYRQYSGFQVTRIDQTAAGRPQFVSGFLVDPQTFPPTGDLRLLEPAGATLADVFSRSDTGEYANEIVVSRNLADLQDLALGDTVRVSGTTEIFTVVGIAPTEAESSFTNLLAGFFGFAYIPFERAAVLDLSENPDTISIVLANGGSEADVNEAAARLFSLGIAGRYEGTPEIIARNAAIGDVISRFVVILGLGALLLGGVGIINTMLAMVGRRTQEIAALKTFGVKGRQVAVMFFSEALLLGVIGSAVGMVAGVALSALVNQYGEAFLNQPIRWRIYPEALLFGAALGVVVTMVFGVLPVLTAVRVRPNIILRPNETVVPVAGFVQALITLLLVILVIGVVAGQIIGNVVVGIIAIAITLLVLALLVCLMWVIVWLVGRLPTFRSVDLRLALRNLSARRLRTATTLLALTAGMFALSSISFVGIGTREILNFQLTQNLGGNVFVVPLLGAVNEGLGRISLQASTRNLPGLRSSTTLTIVNVDLVSVNGVNVQDALRDVLPDQVPERVQRNFEPSLNVQVRETEGEVRTPLLVAGRALSSEDAGQLVMLAPANTILFDQPVNLGSEIVLDVRGRTYPFEVVGLTQATSAAFGSFGDYTIPPGVVQASNTFPFYILDIEPEQLNAALLRLTENPLLLALDVTFIDGLLTRLIDQFSAIPTVVGLLSLLAAAISMANTVSLAMLERRRSIGVLKAIGLKRNRVLGVLLLENSIIGLLGGLLGIGVSALVVALLTLLGQGDAIPLPRDAAPVAALLMLAALVIAWVSTLLSATPITQERVTSVLRYE